jgi:hypothetical protein
MTNLKTITPKQAPDLLAHVIRANLVPMLTSSPGMGKSSIAKQVADTFNLKLIDVRLAQSDPCDLNGFPTTNTERTKASYVPMDTFPTEHDELPLKEDGTPYAGWFLLLDEFNSAPPSVQSAAYKIVLDRQIGQFNLHPKVAIMAAGNLSTDKAIVNRMSTAMQSRMVHFEMSLDVDAWLEWASNNNIDYRITSFINYDKAALHKFDPKHNDHTFPCPRTWEFMSKLVKPIPTIGFDMMSLLQGTVGPGMGTKFLTFCDIFNKLPNINDIINNSKTMKVPEEPDVCYAVAGLISNHIDSNNATALLEFLQRMPVEFQVVTLKGAIRQNATLASNPDVLKWVTKNAKAML